MSCYLMDDDTISALVVYSLRFRSGFGPLFDRAGFNIHELSGYGIDWAAVTKVAQLLLEANLGSVNARYRENNKAHAIQLDKFFLDNGLLDAVKVLSLCNTYEYQACELPDWETSKAKAVIEAIRDLAINHLPGYADAPSSVYELKKATAALRAKLS